MSGYMPSVLESGPSGSWGQSFFDPTKDYNALEIQITSKGPRHARIHHDFILKRKDGPTAQLSFSGPLLASFVAKDLIGADQDIFLLDHAEKEGPHAPFGVVDWMFHNGIPMVPEDQNPIQLMDTLLQTYTYNTQMIGHHEVARLVLRPSEMDKFDDLHYYRDFFTRWITAVLNKNPGLFTASKSAVKENLRATLARHKSSNEDKAKHRSARLGLHTILSMDASALKFTIQLLTRDLLWWDLWYLAITWSREYRRGGSASTEIANKFRDFIGSCIGISLKGVVSSMSLKPF